MTDERTNERTDEQTFVNVELLSRLKIFTNLCGLVVTPGTGDTVWMVTITIIQG